jgi:hypothetical protein
MLPLRKIWPHSAVMHIESSSLVWDICGVAGRSEIPCSKPFHCAWWHPSRFSRWDGHPGDRAFFRVGEKMFGPKPGHGLTPELFVSREELMRTPRLQQDLAEAHWMQTGLHQKVAVYTQRLQPTQTNWLVVICMVQRYCDLSTHCEATAR